MLYAIAHIFGAVIVTTALAVVKMFTALRLEKRAGLVETQNLSIQLGIPIDDMGDAANENLILDAMSKRFSSDLLSNRLSDLCGLLLSAWAWGGLLLQTGVFITVIWRTAAVSTENVEFVWLLTAISLLLWISSAIFSFVCRLLTGRYPGQAKLARKELLNLLNKKRTAGALQAA